MRTNPHLMLCSTLLTFIAGCGGSASNPSASTAPAPSIQQTAVITPAPTQPTVEAATPAVTRPSIVTLRFNPASIDAIDAGTKTVTCRKGSRAFPGNVAIATDGKRKLNLVILSTATRKLSELSDSDAQADGSGTADALKASLRKSYPEIADDDVVTVVSFHVAR